MRLGTFRAEKAGCMLDGKSTPSGASTACHGLDYLVSNPHRYRGLETMVMCCAFCRAAASAASMANDPEPITTTLYSMETSGEGELCE